MQINLLNLQISKKYIRRSFYRKRNKKDHKKNSLYKLNNSQKQKRKTKEKLNFKFKFCEFRRNPTKKRQARDTKSSKKMHLKTLGNLDRLVNFKIFENQSSFLNPKFQQGDSGLSKPYSFRKKRRNSTDFPGSTWINALISLLTVEKFKFELFNI